MALPAQHLFSEIYRIHGHRCPMSTLGGRLGYAAKAILGKEGPLTGTYFIDTCAADGISVMTGCQKSDGTLRIVERNRHALWLENSAGGGLYAELTDHSLQMAGEYRTLDLSLHRDGRDLSATERQERQAEKELFLETLLQRLWVLPDEELLVLSTTLPDDLLSVRRTR